MVPAQSQAACSVRDAFDHVAGALDGEAHDPRIRGFSDPDLALGGVHLDRGVVAELALIARVTTAAQPPQVIPVTL
ncbi:hypothetical protein [Microvirga sp. Mcv34]|uniref:hypothetical protein n=1 Tax=Microvirga sp. Mcv34 TaxID=2926016 RepID=UPI0021C625B3|nr:hypothetical protein [Microvirga sp. Mcv34]